MSPPVFTIEGMSSILIIAGLVATTVKAAPVAVALALITACVVLLKLRIVVLAGILACTTVAPMAKPHEPSAAAVTVSRLLLAVVAQLGIEIGSSS